MCSTPLEAKELPRMKTVHIGGDKQVFVGPWAPDGRDEYLVESMTDVRMTVNPAHVTGERLIVNDRPWEGEGILDMRQFVMKDGCLFRMYYSALPHHFVSDDPDDPRKNLWRRPCSRVLCYAESEDGMHWRKPELGLCEWEGSRANNILIPNDDFGYLFSEVEGACPFIDPAARTPEEKYKTFLKISPVREGGTEEDDPIPRRGTASLPKGQYAFSSPDGIHWSLMSERRVNAGPSTDTQYSVFWDERAGKYVQYSRVKLPDPAQDAYYRSIYPEYEPEVGKPRVLYVGRAESDDFLNWGEEQKVLGPDEMDRANCPEGLVRLDFYGGNVSRYREATGAYIGLPNAYYHWKFDMSRRLWTGKYIQLPSTMDVQLVTSRDGIHWNRSPQRRPFIALGPKGTFWSHQIYPGSDAIRVGDELWFYFAGLNVNHKEQSLRESNGARGRAVLRLDGFISADAAYTGGELTTKPLVFSGDRLQLNVDTGAGGTTKVEIQEPSGRPIAGFTESDADEINGNYIRVLASWNGSTDAGSLAGQPVRLRFLMRDAKLFSFQFITVQVG